MKNISQALSREEGAEPVSHLVSWVWGRHQSPCIGLLRGTEGMLTPSVSAGMARPCDFVCLRVQGCPGKNKGQTLENVCLLPSNSVSRALFFRNS